MVNQPEWTLEDGRLATRGTFQTQGAKQDV